MAFIMTALALRCCSHIAEKSSGVSTFKDSALACVKSEPMSVQSSLGRVISVPSSWRGRDANWMTCTVAELHVVLGVYANTHTYTLRYLIAIFLLGAQPVRCTMLHPLEWLIHQTDHFGQVGEGMYVCLLRT